MSGINKINKICKEVLKLKASDFKETKDMTESQAFYTHPLKHTSQSEINKLGSHNMRILEALQNLKSVIENY